MFLLLFANNFFALYVLHRLKEVHSVMFEGIN